MWKTILEILENTKTIIRELSKAIDYLKEVIEVLKNEN